MPFEPSSFECAGRTWYLKGPRSPDTKLGVRLQFWNSYYALSSPDQPFLDGTPVVWQQDEGFFCSLVELGLGPVGPFHSQELACIAAVLLTPKD